MGPAEECDDAPPEALEEGELRGPMDGYPRVSDCLARPLAQRLMEGLQARGDDVIQVYPREGVRWTARRVLQRGLQLAAGMQMLGVKPGDRVSMVCGRHPEYGPLYFATLAVGAAWAPLNHTFDDGDLRLLLGILEPRVVLAEREVADRLRPLLAELQSPSTLAVLCEGEEWAALATDAAPDTWPPLPPPPADPRGAIAVVACSSGTSGLPKACTTSHFAIIAALSVFSRHDAVEGIIDTMVLTSPGFWVTGIWFTLLSMLDRSTLVYVFGCDEHQFLEAIEKHKPPVIFTANNFLLSVAKVHEASEARRDLSSLRAIVTGGAAMSRQAEEFAGSIMGAEVFNMYGMTELNGGIGMTKRSQSKPGSVGTLSALLRCRVVDAATGRVCGPHEEGELRFKGPMLAQGYLKNPQASAELFDATGWLRTGDLGLYDEDGFFYVTGRIKDTIKYRGAHVSVAGGHRGHPGGPPGRAAERRGGRARPVRAGAAQGVRRPATRSRGRRGRALPVRARARGAAQVAARGRGVPQGAAQNHHWQDQPRRHPQAVRPAAIGLKPRSERRVGDDAGNGEPCSNAPLLGTRVAGRAVFLRSHLPSFSEVFSWQPHQLHEWLWCKKFVLCTNAKHYIS